MVIRKRLNIPGPALVFITTTCIDWSPVFANKASAKGAIEQLAETVQHYSLSMVGYVLMPTHLHVLIGLPDLQLLSQFMESFKSLSSRRVKQLHLLNSEKTANFKYKLWMPRFDDIVIKSEKQFRIKLDYIHNNPVRAGLVKKANDWEYSSAGDWLGGKPGFIPIDKEYQWTEGI
jgi:putative transposase